MQLPPEWKKNSNGKASGILMKFLRVLVKYFKRYTEISPIQVMSAVLTYNSRLTIDEDFIDVRQ